MKNPPFVLLVRVTPLVVVLDLGPTPRLNGSSDAESRRIGSSRD
jgi:hypothetical protein